MTTTPVKEQVSKATAPGKAILFGEHAVVYGRPAIAVPINQVWATAEIRPASSGFEIRACDLGQVIQLETAADDDPLAAAVRITLKQLKRPLPAATLTISSTIPVASGLGSGAAVTVAIIRALARYLQSHLDDQTISRLAFEIEKLHHGTPSGIDNTVVTFRRPVYFVRDKPIQTFHIHTPFQLLIADSGISSPTRATVSDVRAGWQERPASYESLFDQIGQIVMDARRAIETGSWEQLGPLMTHNHQLLQALDVSSPALNALIAAAMAAGADGAKLSGGGRGGNLIALVRSDSRDSVRRSLEIAGAAHILVTWVKDNG